MEGFDDAKKLLDTAHTRALKFLSYRPRSEKEVSDYLLQKKFESLIISKLIELLKEQKFLDDREFAKWWVEQRQSHRAKGKLIIKNELRQKGIGEDIIEKVLEESQDDYKTALEFFEKKKKRFENLSGGEYLHKAAAFLQRRGFAWDTVYKVLKNYKQ